MPRDPLDPRASRIEKFRLTEAMADELTLYCQHLRLHKSVVMRRMLQRWLDEVKKVARLRDQGPPEVP